MFDTTYQTIHYFCLIKLKDMRENGFYWLKGKPGTGINETWFVAEFMDTGWDFFGGVLENKYSFDNKLIILEERLPNPGEPDFTSRRKPILPGQVRLYWEHDCGNSAKSTPVDLLPGDVFYLTPFFKNEIPIYTVYRGMRTYFTPLVPEIKNQISELTAL